MTFGFWKRLLNLRLLRSFLKSVHEPVRLLQFIPHIIPFRYKFSQMLLSFVHRCHFPVTMFFRLQRYVVSGGIALQNREVFSYLQILFFGFCFSVQVISTFSLLQYSRQIVLPHYLLGILNALVVILNPGGGGLEYKKGRDARRLA